MSEHDQQRERRQRVILGGIYFTPGEMILARRLREVLEETHGTSLSMDALRGDLLRLADAGAVQFKDDIACLTEYGNDAVRGRVKLPGWA